PLQPLLFAAGHEALQRQLGRAAQRLRDQPRDRLSQQLLAAITEQFLGPGVERDEPALAVDRDDAVLRRLDDGAELQLGLLERPASELVTLLQFLLGPARHAGRESEAVSGHQGLPGFRLHGWPRNLHASTRPSSVPRYFCSMIRSTSDAVGSSGLTRSAKSSRTPSVAKTRRSPRASDTCVACSAGNW